MQDNLLNSKRCFRPWQWYSEDGEPEPPDFNGEALMWVYRLIDNRYHVGYFFPDRTWFTESSYETSDHAAARVNYLNGGRGE